MSKTTLYDALQHTLQHHYNFANRNGTGNHIKSPNAKTILTTMPIRVAMIVITIAEKLSIKNHSQFLSSVERLLSIIVFVSTSTFILAMTIIAICQLTEICGTIGYVTSQTIHATYKTLRQCVELHVFDTRAAANPVRRCTNRDFFRKGIKHELSDGHALGFGIQIYQSVAFAR